MESTEFWITLTGLLSGLTSGILLIAKPGLIKTLKWINTLLFLLVIGYITYYYISEKKKINDIESKIANMPNNSQGHTLSEITIYLRNRGYDDAKYSKAIRDMLDKGGLNESLKQVYDVSNNSYQCLIYH
jgi:cbb3-type cytochrome oxidase subunit 3